MDICNYKSCNEFLEKFITDEIKKKYFEDNSFNIKVKELIKYYEYERDIYTGGIKSNLVNLNQNDIEVFYDAIINDIFLKVLYKLRNNILKNKRNKNKIFKDEKLVELYKEIFFWTKEDIMNIIKCSYLTEFYNKLKSKSNYSDLESVRYFEMVDNFEKDNTVLKMVALKVFSNEIIEENYLGEKKGSYEIELKCKPNSFHKVKSIRADKAKGLRDVIEALSDLVKKIDNSEVKFRVDDYNIWISLYEINKKYGYISSVAIGRVLEKHMNYIYTRSKKCKDIEKEEIVMENALKILVSNNIFLLNYFLNHDSKLVSFLAGEEEENINFLSSIYELVDNISEKLYIFIKNKDSLLDELIIIREINLMLKGIDYKNLIEKNINNGPGKGIRYAYQIFHQKN